MPSFTELSRTILTAVDSSGLSDRAVSLKATGKPAALKQLRNGHAPNIDTLNRLCRTLNLDFYVGPLRPEIRKNEPESSSSTPGVEASPAGETRKNKPDFSSSEGMTRFSEVELPVMGWAKCALGGHHELTEEQALPELPMPEAMDTFEDGGIFYIIAKGSSMIPEGIEKGLLPSLPRHAALGGVAGVGEGPPEALDDQAPGRRRR